MAEAIGALRADLSANHAKFTADMGKARAAVQTNASGMSRAMLSVKNSFQNSIKSLMGFRSALIAIGAVTAFGMFIKKSIDVADQLSKMSQKVGLSTEQLSTLKYAADISGVSLEGLGKGLIKISRTISDASQGLSTAKDAFAMIGLTYKTTTGDFKSADQVLMEVATKFKDMADGTAKTAVAVSLFGKSGAELIPLLNLGADGIGKLQARAKELGLELSGDAGRAAEEFNDQLTDLRAEASGFGMDIAKKVVPWLNDYVRIVRLAYNESGALMAVWVALGGIGEAAFGSTLQDNIDKTKEKLADLMKHAQGVKTSLTLLDLLKGFKGFEKELATLEARQKSIEEARTKAFEKRREQQAKEDEMRERNAAIVARAVELEKQREEAVKKTQAEVEKLYTSTRTPQEMHAEQMERINALYKVGAIDIDLYTRAVTAADDELAKALEKTKEKADETEEKFAELKQAIEGWGKDSADAIVEFALTGKSSFSDMINSMIKDMLKMLVYQNLMKPLFDNISKGVTGGFNFSSLLGGLGGSSGGLFGGGMLIGGLHGGGIVGKEKSFSRSVSPNLFANAPRLHGGLMPSEYPAILQKGEGVFTPNQMEALGEGGGATNIFIHAVDAKSFDDLCKRNPEAITKQVMQSLRDNKTRAEMRDLTR